MAMAPSTILAVDKWEMVRQLHAAPAFADRFLTHTLPKVSQEVLAEMVGTTRSRVNRG